MITHRCAICNKTDNMDVTSLEEEYTTDPFVSDPINPLHFICLTCFEEIRFLNDDFGDENESSQCLREE